MKRIVSVLGLFALLITLLSVKVHTPIEPEKDIAPHVVAWRSMKHGNSRFATGFHIKYNNKVYIVTNKHVCDANIKIYQHMNIQFDDYVGEILAIDDKHDLCLVTSNRKEGLELADRGANEMEKITLVGHPRGLGLTIREGRIIETTIIYTPWLVNKLTSCQRISAIGYRGNSGSPVVNELGKVIGVLFAGSPAYPTEPLIVPFEYLKLFLLNNA